MWTQVGDAVGPMMQEKRLLVIAACQEKWVSGDDLLSNIGFVRCRIEVNVKLFTVTNTVISYSYIYQNIVLCCILCGMYAVLSSQCSLFPASCLIVNSSGLHTCMVYSCMFYYTRVLSFGCYGQLLNLSPFCSYILPHIWQSWEFSWSEHDLWFGWWGDVCRWTCKIVRPAENIECYTTIRYQLKTM
jgi:hypothetical protein